MNFDLALHLQKGKKRFGSQLSIYESWSKINTILVKVECATVHVNEHADNAALPKKSVSGWIDLIL